MKHSSIVKLFTTHLKQALARAMQFAAEFGHKQVTEEHLLYGLASEKGSISSELLDQASFPVDLLKQDLIRRYHTPYFHDAAAIPDLSEKTVTLLTKAVRTAQLHEHTYVGTEHALACLIDMADKPLQELFSLWHVNRTELQRRLLVVLKSTSKFPDLTHTLKDLQSPSDEPVEEQHEFPVLQSLAKEMTSPSTRLLLTAHRPTKELDRVCRFSADGKNNPCSSANPAIGKLPSSKGSRASS